MRASFFYSPNSEKDVVMEEQSPIKLKKTWPLFSAHTISYFRTILLMVFFTVSIFIAEKQTFLPQAQKWLDSLPNGSTIFYMPLMILLIVSTVFFLLALLSDLTRDTKPENVFVHLVTYVLIAVFLPIYLLFRFFIKPFLKTTNSVGKIIKDNLSMIMQIGFASLFLFFSFYYLYPDWQLSFSKSSIILGQRLGLVAEPIPIAGTGSMYPTFPKGDEKDPKLQAEELVATAGMLPYPSGFSFFGFSFGENSIRRGDIVSFSNKKTDEITEKKYGNSSGLIKRVIGVPGDSIELRSGILYINDQPQKEPYVAKSRSTFGGDFLAECKKTVVPSGELFVLGDNRTASNDSRHDVGFIQIADVDHLLAYDKQIGVVDSMWHDPKNDLSENAKISIKRAEILKLINEERKKKDADPLKYNPKLDSAAKLRGVKMLQFDDFTTEAEKSGYPLSRALADAKYENVVYGEFYVQGYFEAQELIENLVEFPKTVEFLSKTDYQEIGFSEVEGNLNGCPSQVIVFHLGGYVAPNYTDEDISGWRKSLSNLKGIQPSWSELRSSGRFYDENKTDVDRINELISTTIVELERIIKQMESNQWLTEAQRGFADRQEQVYGEVDSLTKKLNEQSKNFNR